MEAFDTIAEVLKEANKKGPLYIGQSRGYILNDCTVILHMAEGKELKVKATLDDPRMHEEKFADEVIAKLIETAKADTTWENGDEEIHVFSDAMIALEREAEDFKVTVYYTVAERLDLSLNMTA